MSVRVVCRVRPINKNEEKKGEKSVIIFKGHKIVSTYDQTRPPTHESTHTSYIKILHLFLLCPHYIENHINRKLGGGDNTEDLNILRTALYDFIRVFPIISPHDIIALPLWYVYFD